MNGSLTISNNNTFNSSSSPYTTPRKRSKDVEVKFCKGYMNKLGAIDTSTANIGGNIMVRQIQKHHTLNLMSVTKTIDTTPPWSYRQHQSPKAALQPTNSSRSSFNPPSPIVKSQQKVVIEKLDLNKENMIDIEQELDEKDQIIYKQFLEMLSKRKCLANAKLLATQAYEKIEEEDQKKQMEGQSTEESTENTSEINS